MIHRTTSIDSTTWMWRERDDLGGPGRSVPLVVKEDEVDVWAAETVGSADVLVQQPIDQAAVAWTALWSAPSKVLAGIKPCGKLHALSCMSTSGKIRPAAGQQRGGWRGARWSNMNWPQGSPAPHSHVASVQVSFPCGVLAWPTFWSMHWHLPVQGAAAQPTLRLAAAGQGFLDDRAENERNEARPRQAPTASRRHPATFRSRSETTALGSPMPGCGVWTVS